MLALITCSKFSIGERSERQHCTDGAIDEIDGAGYWCPCEWVDFDRPLLHGFEWTIRAGGGYTFEFPLDLSRPRQDLSDATHGNASSADALLDGG